MRSIVPGSWALVALAACGASGTDGTRSPELVLDHVASWPAVATDIRAGAILDDSSIVVWNDSGAVWVGRGRGELVAVASPPLVLGRHVDVGTGLARGVDRETGEILTVNADGVVSDSRDTCPAARRAEEISVQDDFILQAEATHRAAPETLVFLRRIGRGCVEEERYQLSLRGGRAAFTELDDGILVSFESVREPPLLVRPDRRPRIATLQVSSPWLDEEGDSAAWGSPIGARWYALPFLVLDDGFTRVVADLRSDRRVFEVRRSDLSLRRRTNVAAPLAFFSSRPDLRLILGMRGGDVMDFVLFRWAWQDP